jgi:hypothetical protein
MFLYAFTRETKKGNGTRKDQRKVNDKPAKRVVPFVVN